MSVTIETTEELLMLLRKLNVKVSSMEELRDLLASINANYNPQAARLRTAKLVALGVPCGLGGIAGVLSLFLTLTAHSGGLSGEYFLGALALVWGCCALVSIFALIFSFALLLGRPARGNGGAPAARGTAKRDDRFAEAITPELSL